LKPDDCPLRVSVLTQMSLIPRQPRKADGIQRSFVAPLPRTGMLSPCLL
jgi:hypothetical protein